MSTLCRQTLAINVGSNLQNAGLLRSLLGQLMPLVYEVRLCCNHPWSTPLESSGVAAHNEVLNSFRLELIDAVDKCIAAVKEKTRVFQKRVMRKTTTTPIKSSPPILSVNAQGSPASNSPKLSPAMPRFRSELLSSQNAVPVPAFFSQNVAARAPSSILLPLATCFLFCDQRSKISSLMCEWQAIAPRLAL